jgi:methanogenic corrinoid protein MtbC1
MAEMQELIDLTIKGKSIQAKKVVLELLDQGVSANSILNDGLLVAMSKISKKFEVYDVFVPEVLIVARVMNKVMKILDPLLTKTDRTYIGKAIVGTVEGDLHDIGKNLVILMFRSKGIETIDIGTDVTPKRFIEVAIEEKAQIIACSTLLTITMDKLNEVVGEAKRKKIRDKVFIMIGGAPVTQPYCLSIGADAYTENAALAASRAEEYLLSLNQKSNNE